MAQAEAAGRAPQLPRASPSASTSTAASSSRCRIPRLRSLAQQIEARLPDYPAGSVAIAVCLLFSYVNPDHELRVRDFLRERFPDIPVSLSHEVAPIWREYERGSTVIADSYVKPVMQRYIASTRQALAPKSLARALVADEVERRQDDRRAGGSGTDPAAALGSGGRAHRRALLRAAGRAREPRHARHGGHQLRRRPDPRRQDRATRPTSRSSSACRWRRRRSISPPSARAAAASPGSTRAGCYASDRRAPAPSPARSATTPAARR